MNFNEVKELISILDDSKLAYFELENEDGYIKRVCLEIMYLIKYKMKFQQ